MSRQITSGAIVYPALLREMTKRRWSVYRLTNEMEVCHITILRKMQGKRDWKLWECIEIKRLLGVDMPLEELFQKEGDPEWDREERKQRNAAHAVRKSSL